MADIQNLGGPGNPVLVTGTVIVDPTTPLAENLTQIKGAAVSDTNALPVKVVDAAGVAAPIGTAADPVRVDPTGTTAQPVTVTSAVSYVAFGAAGNLAAALNSAVTVANTLGMSTITFTLTIPPAATVTFEGSFDEGVSYSTITIRAMGADGYATTATTSGSYVGSIVGCSHVRARVSVAGSGAAGGVVGRLSQQLSTLEGIENPAPSDFALNRARGRIQNTNGIHKFGRNPDIDTTIEAIWAYGGLYTFSASAETWYLVSSSAADVAVTITAEVLDGNYVATTRTTTLTGQTPVAIAGGTILRVNRAYNSSGTVLVGNVYMLRSVNVTAGVPNVATDVRAMIQIGEEQTLQAMFTVPASTTAYLTQWAGGTDTGTAQIILSVREFGKVFRTRDRSVAAVGGGFDQAYGTYLSIPEKSDILVEALTSANNTAVTADYDLILIVN